MGRISRKERRRVKRLRKHKEAARRRHENQAFFGAFRRMLEGGWAPEDLDTFYEEHVDPEDTHAFLEHACNAYGLRPGDPDSWEFIAESLFGADAPPDEILSVLRKWIRAHPEDPRPHLRRFLTLFTCGLLKQAERAVEDALASPAGEAARESLETACRKMRIPLKALGDAESLREHSRRLSDPRHRAGWRALPPPRRAGGDAADRGAGRKARAAPDGPVADAPAGVRGPAAPVVEGPAIPAVARVAFVASPGDGLLKRLLHGPHDDLATIDLARRATEILAEDRYDRLLSLSTVRGVDSLTYQIETVLRVLKRFRGRVLLADEVGLGKTIEACFVLKEYMIRGQVRRALILVPPALVGQWKAELAEKFGIGARTTQDPAFRRDPEGFWQGGPVLVASLALARKAAHRARVLRQRYDMVIVDEAHHLKNRSTRGWELVNGLRSRFFLMLTATPVETNLTELYNLVTLLRPGTLGTEAQFRRRFVRADDPTQPRDPEKLRELLREVMVRNTRALCGVVLPPRTARTLVIGPASGEEALYRLVLDATRAHGAAHRTLFRLLLEEAGSSPRAVAETAARARRRAGGGEIARILERIEEAARAVERTAKFERLAELLPGGKVLVFSRFRATMDQIAADIAGRGIPFVPFHGGMKAAEKDRAVEAFAAPGIHVMLCSEIGGEGRNLQFCHRLVNFDLPWNPMAIEQRIGRIHRIGQTETVEVTNLACAGTAEERILEVLDRRVNLFELVVGEMDLLLGDLADERDFGERIFDIYARSGAEEEVEAGFDELAETLLAARGRLERTKALDEALFGEEYEA